MIRGIVAAQSKRWRERDPIEWKAVIVSAFGMRSVV